MRWSGLRAVFVFSAAGLWFFAARIWGSKKANGILLRVLIVPSKNMGFYGEKWGCDDFCSRANPILSLRTIVCRLVKKPDTILAIPMPGMVPDKMHSLQMRETPHER